MTETLERKSVLARLLANENISVLQGNFDTASFDVDKRVLRLPAWQDMDNDLYDLLVGHEVSHALNTPADKEVMKSPDYPFSYLNIVEDVRIEKMILRRYPGLVGNFKRGYKNMVINDFFRLKGRDPNELGFMDRLNIHAKTRGLVEITFTDEEWVWVNKVFATETFEQVVQLTKEIALWLKWKNHQEEQSVTFVVPDSSDASENSGENEAEGNGVEIEVEVLTTDDSGSESETPESENEEETGTDSGDTGEEESGQGESSEENEEETDTDSDKTDDGEASSEDDAKSDKTANSRGADEKFDPNNLGFDPDGHVLPEAETSEVLENAQAKHNESGTIYARGMNKEQVALSTIEYKKVLEERERVGTMKSFDESAYAEWLSGAKKAVAPMVKEFEMRKAAYRSARARTSTRGTLDVNKLHSYRYDDMLFKQITQLADGKNHGMLMFIDHSGSMARQISAVRRQTLILAMFCKRVGIPFEVYSFTSIHAANGTLRQRIHEKKQLRNQAGVSFFRDELMLTHLLSSQMRKREYDLGFRQLFQLSCLDFSDNRISIYDRLHQTPLNAALASVNVIAKDFQKRNRVEKMNVVFLTDGDNTGSGDIIPIDSTTTGLYGKKIVVDHGGTNVILKKGDTRENTCAHAKALRDQGMRLFNFFVSTSDSSIREEIKKSLAGTEAGRYFAPSKHEYDQKELNALMRQMRNEGVASLDENYGFTRRFFLIANDPQAKRMLGVAKNKGKNGGKISADMNTQKVAKSFSEKNKQRKHGRILAQKFCEIVA